MTGIQYGQHDRIPTGTPCSICAAVDTHPATDHCHAHGWVRDTLCSNCNVVMAFIDRGITPSASSLNRVPIAALVKHAGKCPDCAPINVALLGPTRSFNAAVRRAVATRYTLRTPDDLYARIKAAAERDRRSIHAQILWLLTRALQEEGGTPPS